MSREALTLAYATSRIGYGAGLMFAPRKVGEPWLGEGLRHGAARAALRGLGARDGLVSAGLLHALRSDRDPLPWLGALVASDIADITVTALDAGDLPDGAVPKTALVAGVFAAWGLALALAHRS